VRRALSLALVLFACRAEPEVSSAAVAPPPSTSLPHNPAPPRATGPASPPAGGADASRFPAPARLVAFGDVHGDLAATRRVLRLAGAIDADDHWVGGPLVVVQTGDQLDRGDEERKIQDLFVRLEAEARAAGGAFHVLLGNHELMNVLGDLRYVTPGGFSEFADLAVAAVASLPEVPEAFRGRVAAFRPGGVYARNFGSRRVVVIVGDTVFSHAGVLPEAASAGIDRLNAAVAAWVRGDAGAEAVVAEISRPDSPIWTRELGGDLDPQACARLGDALARLGARRMVVGHTVQPEGITSACDGRVWRIDVGLAAYYGGPTQALEIVGDDVRILDAAVNPSR
jgi:hypothetical protein